MDTQPDLLRYVTSMSGSDEPPGRFSHRPAITLPPSSMVAEVTPEDSITASSKVAHQMANKPALEAESGQALS